MENKHGIILFDGVCNLCDGAVRFIFKHDTKEIFRYQSLQSAQAKELLQQFNYDAESMKSFVLVWNHKLYIKSSAALQIAKLLGFPYSIASIFFIVPKFLRNTVYDFISKNRYKWFGKKKEVCEFNPEFNARKTWNK